MIRKFQIQIEGLNGYSYYPQGAIDLSQIAVAADNSGGETMWRLWMNSGIIFNVKPLKNDYGYSFQKLLEDMEQAKGR